MESDAGGPGFMERAQFVMDSFRRSWSDDPCKSFLLSYEKCVAAQKNGLSEGNDCGKEGEEYKKCRKTQKNTKK